MEIWQQWLVGGVALLIVEMLTPGAFLFLCFAVGAFIASVTSYYGFTWWGNWLVFIGIGLGALFSLRPLFKKKLEQGGRPSNVDALIGATAIIDEKGRVRVEGEEWLTMSDENYSPGTKVKVTAIHGNKLKIVKE